MTNPTQLIEQLASLLKRYRTETPLGHQPYLIAETVDGVLSDARAHLEQPTEPAPSTAGERAKVVEDLLMYAGDNGYSHIDYADTMRHAAALLQSTALPHSRRSFDFLTYWAGQESIETAPETIARNAWDAAKAALPVGELTPESILKAVNEAGQKQRSGQVNQSTAQIPWTHTVGAGAAVRTGENQHNEHRARESDADSADNQCHSGVIGVSSAREVHPNVKRWPFEETPGEFTERLREAIRSFDGYLLGAVRSVLIENPPVLAAARPQPVREPLMQERDKVAEAMRKQFVTLPRYSFLLDALGNVRRVPMKTGNWVEFTAAHELFDPVCVDAAMESKPLTDDQIYELYSEPCSDAEMLEFARAIEAAHGITQGGKV